MKKITFLVLVLVMSINCFAQWNSDTAVNTLVADSNVTDTQSVVGSNGKTYTVFWKSVPTINFELRIQILDENGNQELGNEGALISNTIPMSTFTQIWSLTLDEDNNVYVGVTGTDGNGGYAFKMDSMGNNLWTSNGISLGTAYLVRLLPLDSGDVMISWLNGSTFNGELQKFDENGNTIWESPTAMGSGTVSANMYELSNGDIISIYHQLGSGITSTLYAQRFNGSGESQWSSPTQLFAAGNNTAYNVAYYGLQDGDTIYYSYKLAHDSRFDAYVQRINPDGSLPWGITGMDFDINQGSYEQEIQIGHTDGSPNIWAICRYTDQAQGQVGIYVQKFDKDTGSRLLTDSAKEIYALGNTTPSPIGNFRVTALDEPIFLTNNGTNLEVNLLDENGDFVWIEEAKPVATFNAAKSRVNFLSKPGAEEYIVTFLEDKGNGDQVFAQNFTDDELLSVETFVNNNAFQYANPITDVLFIKSTQEIDGIAVYNNLGQMIVSKNLSGQTIVEINSQSWAPGIYYAKLLSTNGSIKTIKVLKH